MLSRQLCSNPADGTAANDGQPNAVHDSPRLETASILYEQRPPGRRQYRRFRTSRPGFFSPRNL